ncbi:MAG: hypothetical protein L0Z53_21180, partial [Acidobacteriales bacterium]|nr:hypothetical protein [Terriglobales bacterium]
NPTALTPVILERAGQAGEMLPQRLGDLRRLWERHETLRELYRNSRDRLTSTMPPLFWIRTGQDRWLATRVTESGTNNWIVARPPTFTSRSHVALPDYLGLERDNVTI